MAALRRDRALEEVLGEALKLDPIARRPLIRIPEPLKASDLLRCRNSNISNVGCSHEAVYVFVEILSHCIRLFRYA